MDSLFQLRARPGAETSPNAPAAVSESPGGAPDPGAFKSVLVRINTDGWRALNMLAVENDTTLNALAVEAFNDLLKKHGKRQSVENPLLD
jgi:hypothetical protein